jgi:RNA polymerase sigma-70 factor, ECF subfamily
MVTMCASVQPLVDVGTDVMDESPLEFDAFFHRHHPRLFAALCLTTGDRHEADEIAQDAFLKLLERWDRVTQMDDPAGYLFTTAMNLFRKRYRRAKLASRLLLVQPKPDDAFATIDDRDLLVRALRDLTPQQRAAIVLTTILDVPSPEAAKALGIKDSTVRVLAKNAREALRASVGDER